MIWLIIAFIVYALFRKKSKLVALFIFVAMFLLMGLNHGNADYAMYNSLFLKYGRSFTYSSAEILFQYLCKLVYSFGKGYNYFLFIYSFIGMALMYLTVRKTSKYPVLVAFLYFGFCFFLDAVQIRHFMASSIVCYGLTFLLKDDRKTKDIVTYIVFNILAVGFHFMAILYFLFLLLPLFENNSFKDTLRKIVLITIPILIIINTSIFFDFIGIFIPKVKIDAYFLSGDWKVSTLVTIVLILVQLIPLVILMLTKSFDKSKLTKKVVILNILLILVTPFYFYTVEFGRVFRGIIIWDYIVLTNQYEKPHRFKILFLSALMMILLFIALILVVGLFDKTVKAIIVNNILFRRY